MLSSVFKEFVQSAGRPAAERWLSEHHSDPSELVAPPAMLSLAAPFGPNA
jgi:hypothetical protein